MQITSTLLNKTASARGVPSIILNIYNKKDYMRTGTRIAKFSLKKSAHFWHNSKWRPFWTFGKKDTQFIHLFICHLYILLFLF